MLLFTVQDGDTNCIALKLSGKYRLCSVTQSTRTHCCVCEQYTCVSVAQGIAVHLSVCDHSVCTRKQLNLYSHSDSSVTFKLNRVHPSLTMSDHICVCVWLCTTCAWQGWLDMTISNHIRLQCIKLYPNVQLLMTSLWSAKCKIIENPQTRISLRKITITSTQQAKKKIIESQTQDTHTHARKHTHTHLHARMPTHTYIPVFCFWLPLGNDLYVWRTTPLGARHQGTSNNTPMSC